MQAHKLTHHIDIVRGWRVLLHDGKNRISSRAGHPQLNTGGRSKVPRLRAQDGERLGQRRCNTGSGRQIAKADDYVEADA